MAKQNLLLVDADERSLRVLEVSLRKAGYSVTTCGSVDNAVELMEFATPDLILSDTRLPERDGFALVEVLQENADWEEIPFIFLSSDGSLESKVRGLELGVEDYLTKPIYIKEIITRVTLVLQRFERLGLERRSMTKTRFSGSLSEMGLVDLLQTIEISRKSGSLSLRNGDKQGQLLFSHGSIVHAHLGAMKGEPAIYRFLVWNDGEFNLEFGPVDPEEITVTAPTQGVLMEGMRRLDEWGRLLEQLPPLDAVFQVDEGELIERLAEIPDDINTILKHFDGRNDLLSVVDHVAKDDLETLLSLSKLYFEGLIIPIPDAPDEPSEDLLVPGDGIIQKSSATIMPPAPLANDQDGGSPAVSDGANSVDPAGTHHAGHGSDGSEPFEKAQPGAHHLGDGSLDETVEDPIRMKTSPEALEFGEGEYDNSVGLSSEEFMVKKGKARRRRTKRNVAEPSNLLQFPTQKVVGADLQEVMTAVGRGVPVETSIEDEAPESGSHAVPDDEADKAAEAVKAAEAEAAKIAEAAEKALAEKAAQAEAKAAKEAEKAAKEAEKAAKEAEAKATREAEKAAKEAEKAAKEAEAKAAKEAEAAEKALKEAEAKAAAAKPSTSTNRKKKRGRKGKKRRPAKKTSSAATSTAGSSTTSKVESAASAADSTPESSKAKPAAKTGAKTAASTSKKRPRKTAKSKNKSSSSQTIAAITSSGEHAAVATDFFSAKAYESTLVESETWDDLDMELPVSSAFDKKMQKIVAGMVVVALIILGIFLIDKNYYQPQVEDFEVPDSPAAPDFGDLNIETPETSETAETAETEAETETSENAVETAETVEEIAEVEEGEVENGETAEVAEIPEVAENTETETEIETEPEVEAPPAPTGAYADLLAEAMGIRSRTRRAEKLREAIAVNPNGSEALAELSFILLNRGRMEEAGQLAERATTIDPTSAKAWITLGSVRQTQRDREGARQAFQSCVDHGVGRFVRECRSML